MQPTDGVNVAQAAAWDGEEGDDWAAKAEHHDAAAARHNARLREAAQVGIHEHVLDVGCGNGQTTREAARAATAGAALGIDLSSQMLARARDLAGAEGLTNVTFRQADAQVHRFADPPFDLAISRFGIMFFDDPVAAFTNIGGALRSGGRVALLAWQALPKNEWVSSVRDALAVGRALPLPPADAPGPFSFADPDRVRVILNRAGFDDVEIASVNEPVSPGVGADDAFRFFRGSGIARGLLNDLDERDRERALDALRAAVVAHDTGHGVQFDSAAWLITARRG